MACRVWVFDAPARRGWSKADRSRLAVRCAAAAAGVDEADVEIGHDAAGRPLLRGPQAVARRSISWSDTAHRLAVAVHDGGPVGIDIEALAGRAVAAGPLPWLAAAESAAIAAAPAERRREAFIAIWTQKEAYLKALGLGIAGGLGSFEVDTCTAGLARARAGAPPLQLHRIAGPGWLGAVACNGAIEPTICWP